jgi:hypothetical protein
MPRTLVIVEVVSALIWLVITLNMFALIKRARKYLGYDKDSAETFDRLIQSTHVEDLRWLVVLTTILAIFGITVVVITSQTMGPHSQIPSNETLFEALMPLHVSAILAGLGGIIAWCYQTGSARLGIVDLFACEITTLCRICTLIQLTDTCVAAFELDSSDDQRPDHDKIILRRETFTHFESTEDYTPVFSANAKDLQALRVKVVTNITAFYTYWKSTRDAFRKMASTPVTVADLASDPKERDLWHGAMLSTIYMQFLCFESARKAVRDLIEFEPNRAENMITILLSELPAYRFMLKVFPVNDFRRKRLELRKIWYPHVAAKVYYQTVDAHANCNNEDALEKQFHHLAKVDLDELRKDWEKAFQLLDELRSRYEGALGGNFPGRDAIVRVGKKTAAEVSPHPDLSAVLP